MPRTDIRHIESDRDAGEWLRMRVALWPDATPESHPKEMREYCGDDPTKVTYVVERPEGGLCGFVEVSLRPYVDGCETSPVGYLEGWYVDEDVRRMGVGRLLVEAAEFWAWAQGCTEMASDCVLDNDVSFCAHTALGYEEIGRIIQFRKTLADLPEFSEEGTS